MDVVLIFFLLIGLVGLATIFIVGFSMVVETKKTRKEIIKIGNLIKTTNTALIHQTSKLEILDRQLRIIGSTLVPEKYKRKAPRNPN
jgi:hypothetical protein